MDFKKKDMASYIDHTLLKADATEDKIKKLCYEAKNNDIYAVCVNPHYVSNSVKILKDYNVKIAAVIGFPLGANTVKMKCFEAEQAAEEGADEVDMVMNIGLFKTGLYSKVEDEIKNVIKVVGKTIVKVIIETGLLDEEEIKTASKIVQSAGADYVKTSTGFGPRGVSVNDISLIRNVIGNEMGIKASGGIKSYSFALELINAGATRIGTSSALQILETDNKI